MTPEVRKCGDIVPSGEEEMTLVARLRDDQNRDGRAYAAYEAAERIEALEAENLRLRELLNEARIYVDECFGDLDRSLSVRIDADLGEPKQEQG